MALFCLVTDLRGYFETHAHREHLSRKGA